MGDHSVLASAEEQGMPGMSLMEHLKELSSRIIKALYGLAAAFVLSLALAGPLWDVIKAPAKEALQHLGVNPPRLAVHTPLEPSSPLIPSISCLSQTTETTTEFE
jgi:Sec-independent protein secretion pathway component TatC